MRNRFFECVLINNSNLLFKHADVTLQNIMKYFIFSILTVLSLNMQSYGQKQKDTCKCRVYKTAEDYKNNNPVEGRKIDWGIHFTWKGTEEVLLLKTADSTQKYKAGTAFAYIDTDCKLYRFYNEDYFFEVLYKEGICLYSLHKVALLPKGMAISDTYYYFSKDIFSPIFVLKKENLLNEYAGNTSFCDAVQKVKHDDALSKIDKATKQYKIIELYKQFKK